MSITIKAGVILSAILWPFLAHAFVTLEPDFTKWSQDERAIALLCGGVSAAFAMVWMWDE